MFDLFLFFKMLPFTFSKQKGHLRYYDKKRVIAVLLTGPIFLSLSLIHGIFSLIDEVLFPFYHFQSNSKTAFITGVPRSATTFLFHTLMKDKEHFTGFTFWEVLLAPTITQKVLLLPFIWLIRKWRKLRKRVMKLDDKVFGSFRDIHDTGFLKPEEDEWLMVFIFSSSYLWFFFPDSAPLEDYMYFDEQVPLWKRKEIMGFYYRCVQKHNFIFNPRGRKTFLSKNPTFTPKIRTLCEIFPQGKILYMLRTPYKTIPATISLATHVYQGFSTIGPEPPLVDSTRDMVIRWYETSLSALEECAANRHMIIPFQSISENTLPTLCSVYEFLDLQPDQSDMKKLQRFARRSRRFKSGHQYDKEAGIDKALIERKLGFILHGPWAGKLGH